MPEPKKQKAKKQAAPRRATAKTSGPVTLKEARRLAQGTARPPARALRRRGTAASVDTTPKDVAEEKKQLAKDQKQEREQRLKEYKKVMQIMKARGVAGLDTAEEAAPVPTGVQRAPLRRRPRPAQPLQIFAEGDSWYDYPVPLFGGGVIPRLQNRLGVPILNMAKAGDEVRYMLGVEQRAELITRFTEGCPAGGPWDAMLFSGGGNDIVGNPMSLWLHDYKAGTPPKKLIKQGRYKTALDFVLAGYEDLIELRNDISPNTRLIFHAYDFAIPDGRGVCFMGPWLKPAFDQRKFPAKRAFETLKVMLSTFATMLETLERKNRNVTFINGQGLLPVKTESWHNELHPSKSGFNRVADLFHKKIKDLYPNRVL